MSPVVHPFPWLSLHSAVVVAALVTYVALALARRQRRHPSAALGWVLFLVLVPYLALPLFLLFGTRKTTRARKRPERPEVGRETLQAPSGRFRALALGLGLPPAASYEDLTIHQDGAAALERLQTMMLAARETLEVASFLLGRDPLGDAVVALLAQRAREGVRVRVMIDGVGRYLGGRPTLQPLRDAGVEVALFVRPWSSPLRGRVNLRNHRKVVIVDGDWLWTGGRNLAAEYFVGKGSHHRPEPPWTDLTFDLRGPIARQARQQFECDWAVAQRKPTPELPALELPEPVPGTALAQLLPSGPDQADDTVYELLIDACFSAQRRIVAVTPYFVPDPVLLMAFALAARRGVAVDLLIPRRSNHRLADLARPGPLRELLASGVHISLAPRMLHGKLVIVDEMVALAGSLNLDERSLFLNYEMMVAFYDPQAIARFGAWAEQAREGAALLEPRPVGALREVGEGLLRWLTFQL